jgi:hypothetical protein
MAGDYKLPIAITERVRFYDGQFLQDQDFIDEQKYHLARRNRHHRTLHVTGVAEGLTAYRPANTTFRVKVRAGLAIDPDGRQILLTATSPSLDLPANSANSERWLYIAYHQVPDKLQSSGQGVEGETRWREAPHIFTSDNANLGVDDDYEGPDWSGYLPEADGPPPPVLLAKLTINANGGVTVDNNVRHFSGLRLPGPDSLAPTLRADTAGNVGLWLVKDNDLAQRLTISPDGNVGINTNTPAAALEIRSTLKATVQNRTLVGLKISPTFDAGNLTGVKKYGLIVEAGNVGIGTTTPQTNLEVRGLVRGGYDASNYTEIGHGGGNGYINTVGKGRLDFRHDHKNKMVLTSGGDLGIGTDEPGTALEVRGNVRGAYNANNYTEISHGGSHGYINTVGAGRLDFKHDSNTLMSLTDEGNLGIGTDPGAKLDVNGNIKFGENLQTTGIAQITPIYIRGTGLNNPSNRKLVIGGQTVINSNTAGLEFAIINKADHSVVSTTRYTTMSDKTAADNLATALNGITKEQLGVLASCRAWEGQVTDNLRLAFQRVGLYKALATFGGMRRPYAAIFGASSSDTIGTAKAVEVLHSSNANAPFAEIRGWLMDGAFVATGTVPNALATSNGAGLAIIANETGNVGIGTTNPGGKLHIINAAQEADGDTLVLGSTGSTNLRLGYHSDYSWIQSHGSKPLVINSKGNNVGIGTPEANATLEVNGSFKTTTDASGERALYTESPNDGNHRGDDNTQNATGLVYRVAENPPASGDPILQVRSSGEAVRFFVEHDGWTGSKDNSAWFGGGYDNYFAGKVGIGTTGMTAGAKLTVDGPISENGQKLTDKYHPKNVPMNYIRSSDGKYRLIMENNGHATIYWQEGGQQRYRVIGSAG